MKFAAEIDDALIGSLAGPIAKQLGAEPAKREVLARFALEQMLAWMAGRTSYQSMTEMQADWLMQLLPAFYPSEAPSAERLSNDFAIPYGRAAYLARVLLERQRTVWRALGRKQLHDAIAARKGEADTNIHNSDPKKAVPVLVDAAGYRELKAVLAQLDLANDLLLYLTSRTAGPLRRQVGLPSGLFAQILKLLEA